MSVTNLVNMDVDAVFEQHSISEIDIVQKKIQAVVENKREELRTMVGERYRDLLEAADTITSMQEASSNLITHVDSIISNCRSLNEQQLLGFRCAEDDASDLLRNRSASKQQWAYFSTMVQIKLLIVLPELIWFYIDRQRYCIAAELFLFSRHIITGLQLDAKNTLMRALPVAHKQWEMLKPFQVTIKQAVLTQLEREELSETLATDCLLCLLLLERNNLNGILRILLQLRTTAFLKSLSDESSSEEAKRRVKERIRASLKVLYGTVDLVAVCFLEKGFLLNKLNEFSSPEAAPTIKLMGRNDTQFLNFLPDIITNFRPKFEAQSVDRRQLSETMEQWMEEIERICSLQLRQLFELVSTIGTIHHEFRNYGDQWRNATNSAALADELLKNSTHSLNFYEEHYAPLIAQRVRDIIRDNWQQAMTGTLFDTLQHKVEEASLTQTNDAQCAELSSELLWEDSAEDLPHSLAEALSEDPRANKLLMKIKGYDDTIISMCSSFDDQLASVVVEMDALLQEGDPKAIDKLALLDFLQATAEQEFNAFIEKVKQLNLANSQRPAMLLVVRLLSALLELCANLKICFCPHSHWRQHIEESLQHSTDAWERLHRQLTDETAQFWLQIVKGILAENPCEQFLPRNISYETILEDFARWDTITLEQKDEEPENTPHSTFSIPNQPRISVQMYLFHITRCLNCNSITQTMPPPVRHTFNENLLLHIIADYESYATPICQKIALQLYFDMKFLLKLFAVTRENQALYDKFHSCIDKLKEGIDPFDFELCADHLVENIKRAVYRLSGLFGVLVPNAFRPDAADSTWIQESDPNIFTLCCSSSAALWFPLLPITEDGIETEQDEAAETIKLAQLELEEKTTPTQKPSAEMEIRKSEPSKSKSGASYFFGAMSQDWFR